MYLHSYMHMCTVPHKIFLFELLFEVRVENIELRLRSEFNESMCMSNRATVYFYFIFFFLYANVIRTHKEVTIYI